MADLKGQNRNCGCRGNDRVDSIYESLTDAGAPLAMAFVPYQHWEEPYALNTGLRVGTIFPKLDKPFCGKGGKRW